MTMDIISFFIYFIFSYPLIEMFTFNVIEI
jgi:hypothetical protein